MDDRKNIPHHLFPLIREYMRSRLQEQLKRLAPHDPQYDINQIVRAASDAGFKATYERGRIYISCDLDRLQIDSLIDAQPEKEREVYRKAMVGTFSPFIPYCVNIWLNRGGHIAGLRLNDVKELKHVKTSNMPASHIRIPPSQISGPLQGQRRRSETIKQIGPKELIAEGIRLSDVLRMDIADRLYASLNYDVQHGDEEREIVFMGSFALHKMKDIGAIRVPDNTLRPIGDLDVTILEPTTPRRINPMSQLHWLSERAMDGTGLDTQIAERGYYPKLQVIKIYTRKEVESVLRHYHINVSDKALNNREFPIKQMLTVNFMPPNALNQPPLSLEDDAMDEELCPYPVSFGSPLEMVAAKMLRALRSQSMKKYKHEEGIVSRMPQDIYDIALLTEKAKWNSNDPVIDTSDPSQMRMLRLLVLVTYAFNPFPTKYGSEPNMKVVQPGFFQNNMLAAALDKKTEMKMDAEGASHILQTVNDLFNAVFPPQEGDRSTALRSRLTENECAFVEAIQNPGREAINQPRLYIRQMVSRYLEPEYQEQFEANPQLKLNIGRNGLILEHFDRALQGAARAGQARG